MDGRRIKNVGNPTRPADAATLGLVMSKNDQMRSHIDNTVEEVRESKKNMENRQVNNIAQATEAHHAETKGLLDSEIAKITQRSNTNMNNTSLVNLKEPRLSADASTKNFVVTSAGKLEQLINYTNRDIRFLEDFVFGQGNIKI